MPHGLSELPPHLASAYRASTYSVAGIDLRIGRPSRRLDGLLAGMRTRDAALITAWNPRGTRLPVRINERRMAELRHRLGRSTQLPATGGTRTWKEAHLLVPGDLRKLKTLARLFRQNAIVALTSGRAPRLVELTR